MRPPKRNKSLVSALILLACLVIVILLKCYLRHELDNNRLKRMPAKPGPAKIMLDGGKEVSKP